MTFGLSLSSFGELGAFPILGDSIALSNTSIPQGSANGTTLGTASIVGPFTGTPAWSLSDGTGTFQINSVTGVVTVLNNTDLASPGTIPFTISVSGVSPTVPGAQFTVNITSTAGPSLDFSQAANSQYENVPGIL